MRISSRTPEGTPNRCPICGAAVRIEPSQPENDAPCPQCGALLWFEADGLPSAQDTNANLFFSAAPRRTAYILRWIALIVLAIVLPAAVMTVCFSLLGMTGLGPTEFFILMILTILLFGRRLPEMGRYFGERIVGRNGK